MLGAIPFSIEGRHLADIAPPIRLAILTIVLLRAGLGISTEDIRRSGGLALRLGSIPLAGEIVLLTLAAMWLLQLSFPVALVLGCLVGAISPAIVISGLLELLQKTQQSANRRVLTALLVGAPFDNILALVALGATLDIAITGSISWQGILITLPYRIIGGIGLGLAAGWSGLLLWRNIPKFGKPGSVLLSWAIAGGIVILAKTLDVSFVLALIVLGCFIRAMVPDNANDLATGLQKLWNIAQYVLFALIGAAVDIGSMREAGWILVVVIVLGQFGRATGSILATAGNDLKLHQRIACIFAYIPKATIQAAFAAFPLDRGLAEGELILNAAILAIIITVPCGVYSLQKGIERVLEKEQESADKK